LGILLQKTFTKPISQPQRVTQAPQAKLTPAPTPITAPIPEAKPSTLPVQSNNTPAANGAADLARMTARQSALESQLKDMNQQLVAREAQVKTFSAKIREAQDIIQSCRRR